MLVLRCLFVTLLFNAIRKEPLYVSGSQQCLTWDLYNDENIGFICRVSNFVQPITLTDNHGKLFAQCTFFEKQKSCQPSRINSFVRANYTKNEVVFYVDRDNLWEYNGEWGCHIGREIVISQVSISKGIITETNVRLESTIRKTNVIEIKCSSCKIPVSSNAEFHINGRSEDSLFYDRGSGKCMHHNMPCKPDVCGCSASGTEFFMLFTMNISIHESFSCDLIFLDPVTSAKFSKIATIENNGTGYIQTKTQTKIIKRGFSRREKRVSFQPGSIGTTVTIDQVNSTDENDKHGKNNKGHHLLKWILIGLLFFIVIALTVFSLKKKCRNMLRKSYLPSENSKKQYSEDTCRSSAETLLLGIDGETQHMKVDKSTTTGEENTCTDIEVYAGIESHKCEPCLKQGNQTGAYEYCVNCNELYCLRCSVSHLSMKMTSTHTLIKIYKLLCDLHGKSEYTHMCHSHSRLICDQCLKSRHRHCNFDSIKSIESSHVSIKSDDIDLMKKSTSLTSSTPNMNDLFYAETVDTAEPQHTTCQENNYFQKCIKAVSMLRKKVIQPKSRISFKTKDRESSFFRRKNNEYDLLNTV